MRLQDLFEVLQELGKGGFGRVLLVREKQTQRVMAAKVLNEPTNWDARRRFEREVRQLWRYGRLPHVIRLLGAYLDAEEPFFVMPFAPGGPITPWAGKLDDHQTLTVMRQLMETLAQIHAGRGFHRDVKPDNILLAGNGQAVVADFGLGNNPNCTVHFTMTTGGTPGYAAPELKVGYPFSTACDIFSAGATWFHLVTGKHPRGLADLLDPRSVRAKVDEGTASWILSMTSPDPHARPTATAVLGALKAALQNGEAALPSTKPRGEFPWKEAAAIGGFAAVLLLIAAAIDG